jgi:hypothetical protein
VVAKTAVVKTMVVALRTVHPVHNDLLNDQKMVAISHVRSVRSDSHVQIVVSAENVVNVHSNHSSKTARNKALHVKAITRAVSSVVHENRKDRHKEVTRHRQTTMRRKAIVRHAAKEADAVILETAAPKAIHLLRQTHPHEKHTSSNLSGTWRCSL